MRKILIRSFAAALALLAWLPASLASQANLWSPTTGTVSGLTLTQNYNNGFSALASCNSGATAPANDQTAVAIKGQCWLDTSASPNVLKIYDGANWLTIGAVDTSGHFWKPPVGGGSGTVASGTTTDLCSVADSYVSISGAVTITSFSNTCVAGTAKFVTFASTPQVTYNASSMILPGAASITAQAGDSALFVYLGGGNWKALAWTRADGTAISASAVFTGAVSMQAPITPTALAANTNDWAPTGFSTSNVIRVSSSSAVNLTGIAGGASGRLIYLRNFGSFNITLTSLDTLSASGNRFAIPQNYVLRPNEAVTLLYDITSTAWYVPTLYQSKTPTVQVLTSGTGATYTTAAGVTWLKAVAVAGGGGGAGSGTGSPGNGGTGGTTTFNSVSAAGGVGSVASSTNAGSVGAAGGTGGSGSATLRIAGGSGSGGTSSGGSTNGNGGGGAPSCLGGGGGGSGYQGAAVAGLAGATNTGGGGGGASAGVTGGGGGGGAGECFELIIGSPAATYTYSIGAAGTAGSAGTSGAAGGAGGSGVIFVYEYYNYLLRRDLHHDNDNRPVGLDMAA